MMSFKKILIAVLVTLLLGALVIVPLFSTHEEADNDPIAQFLIKDNLAIIEGKMPPKALALVMEWASIHKKELLNNWNKIIKTGQFNKIKPLE